MRRRRRVQIARRGLSLLNPYTYLPSGKGCIGPEGGESTWLYLASEKSSHVGVQRSITVSAPIRI